jgi:hypothetical protein
MAKRMDYSVVGLPHYTIWHLYEPSVDDIRHMEELENERRTKEEEVKDAEERRARIQEQFDNPSAEWEEDKEKIADMANEQASKDSDEEKEKDSKSDDSKAEAEKDEDKKEDKTSKKAKAKDEDDEKPEKSEEKAEEKSKKSSKEKEDASKEEKPKKVIQHDSNHIKPKEGQIINDHGHIRVIKVPDSDSIVGETTEDEENSDSS